MSTNININTKKKEQRKHFGVAEFNVVNWLQAKERFEKSVLKISNS